MKETTDIRYWEVPMQYDEEQTGFSAQWFRKGYTDMKQKPFEQIMLQTLLDCVEKSQLRAEEHVVWERNMMTTNISMVDRLIV